MLGEANGQITPRLIRAAEIMNQARLNAMISKDIIGWLYTHYVEADLPCSGAAKRFVDEFPLKC